MLILLPPSEKKLQTKAPTPAINVYSGVLYQALGWSTLNTTAKKRAEKCLQQLDADFVEEQIDATRARPNRGRK